MAFIQVVLKKEWNGLWKQKYTCCILARKKFYICMWDLHKPTERDYSDFLSELTGWLHVYKTYVYVQEYLSLK